MPVAKKSSPLLKEIFDEAYLIALPYVDPAQGLGGSAYTRHAYIVLRERFPGLLPQCLSILVRAIERVFNVRTLESGTS